MTEEVFLGNLTEIIDLLTTVERVFMGTPKSYKDIKYKGATVRITVEVIERYEPALHDCNFTTTTHLNLKTGFVYDKCVCGNIREVKS